MTKHIKELYQVTAPHFTAGLIYSRRYKIIMTAAPILSWSLGKPLSAITSRYTTTLLRTFSPNDTHT